MRHAITMPSSTGSSPLKGCGVNCSPDGKQRQPTAGFMTHVTCRLTAKNRDQLRNHTLGDRLWATFLPLQHWRCASKKQTIILKAWRRNPTLGNRV